MSIQLKFKKLHQDAILPVKKQGNIGIDLHCIAGGDWNHPFKKDETTLFSNEQFKFRTGLAVNIPEGYALILKDRSGLAAKHGIHVLAGVIDSSYTGEIIICLANLSESNFDIVAGDRICQAILVPDYEVEISEVDEIVKVTDRGDKGFGSSGK